MPITRRHLLHSLGGGLIAAPFARLLTGGGRAYAQGAATAKRLVVFFSPNGCVHQRWRPAGGERDFSFPDGSVMQALTPLRDRLVVVDGLDFYTGTNHEGGMAAMLTNGGGAGTETRGMSVDQFVASRIGADDRFPSLEFGVLTDPWGGQVQTRMSYRGAGELVHPDADPRRAFGRMFADLLGGDDEIARKRLRRQSVIDLARDELIDIRRRVGRPEQLKLDGHLSALRSLESSLFGEGLECGVPAEPDPLGKDVNDNVPALLDAQINLAVASLACGMTKVATIQLSHTVSPVVFSWVGNGDGHHSLSHASDAQPAKVLEFVDAERWVAEQFGVLVSRLAETPDPEGGGSLLDSTLVMWAKEMGDPRAHVCTDVPFVLAGGGLQGGRYLRYDGESHSHLLVSICHALGVPNETFGDATTGSGPLPGLA